MANGRLRPLLGFQAFGRSSLFDVWQKEYGTTGRQLPGLTLSFTAVVSFLVNNNKMKIETQELVGFFFFPKPLAWHLK